MNSLGSDLKDEYSITLSIENLVFLQAENSYGAVAVAGYAINKVMKIAAIIIGLFVV